MHTVLNIFKQKTNILLVIIILTGAALRFTGTIPGYNPYHSDEDMSYSSAWKMILNNNIDPKRYDYPSLVPLIHNVIFRSFFIPAYWIKYFILNPTVFFSFDYSNLFPVKIIGPDDIHPLFWSRLITAFFSTILIYLSYLLSQKLFNSKISGLLTAALIAVNYRIVLNSHFGLPDIYNSFFFCLSLLATLNLIDKPNLKKYLIAGLMMALSFNVKFQIFSVIPFLLTHLYITFTTSRDKQPITYIKNLFSGKFLLSLIMIPFISLVLNPYHLLNFNKFYEVNYYTYLKYAGANSNIYGISYLYHITLTPLIFFSVISGVVILIIKPAIKPLLALSLVAVFLYTLFWGIGGSTYTRNYISIIPILLIFGGYSFFLLYRLLKNIYKIKLIAVSLFLIIFSLALYPSFINSLILSSEYTTPWEMRKMNNNIYQYFQEIKISNSQKDIKIASHPWDFSVVLSKPNNISSEFIQTDLETQSIYSMQELKEEGTDYALIGMDMVGFSNSWWINSMDKLGFNFWQDKNQILKNQFISLSITELAQKTISVGIKKWQAPDNNYLFVKIPKSRNKNLKLIKSYSFDKKEDINDWQYTYLQSNKNPIKWDQTEGHLLKGAATFSPIVNNFGIYKIVSPVISIEPGKSYLAEAYLKSESKLDKKQREGFLRIDYYLEIPDRLSIKTVGSSVNVSARYFGQNWVRLEAEGTAPLNARFATISFQVSSHTAPKYWIDDIKISKVTDSDKNNVQRTINYKVPDEILFPFSQGGM